MVKKDIKGSSLDSHLVQQQATAVVAAVVAMMGASCIPKVYGPQDLRPPSKEFSEQNFILQRSTYTKESLREAVFERLEPGVIVRVPENEVILES
ncbi:hypothetical protein GUJ93_ZPchr0010g10568 [Zizania palustris]|uniref:Uncharacterized protein n=1 Tax=Zizania palustris TaxID=103762 RepID=A0A8J5T9I5_ZIZPA|nr:hypothetical protein GUJ93_ZPchr0010g10568 [Zizania palustris]